MSTCGFFFAFFACACAFIWSSTAANEVSPNTSPQAHNVQECNPPRETLQVSVENNFLFQKVVGMREEIQQYAVTFLEYEELTTKLTDLNLKMVAENEELKGQFDAVNMANKELKSAILRIQSSSNSNHSNAALGETVRSLSVYAAKLEKEVSWLQVCRFASTVCPPSSLLSSYHVSLSSRHFSCAALLFFFINRWKTTTYNECWIYYHCCVCPSMSLYSCSPFPSIFHLSSIHGGNY